MKVLTVDYLSKRQYGCIYYQNIFHRLQEIFSLHSSKIIDAGRLGVKK